MSKQFIPRVGGVLSADIAVPEHARELRFYSSVLTTGKHPLWREDLMNNHAMPIIGLGERTEDYAELPLQWMPHIQVEDVAASVESALSLGGSELMHGKDEHGVSQWAVLVDPNGAAFGIMPVVPAEAIAAPEADSSTPIGCIAGLDLTVSDAASICDFYSQVVGWSAKEVEIKGASESYADYTMICSSGKPVARICHARGEKLGLPSIWLLNLPVGDLAESLRCIQEGEGEVIKAIQGSDGEYAYAVVQDPVGVCVTLVPG